MCVLFLPCRLPAARLIASLDAHRCADNTQNTSFTFAACFLLVKSHHLPRQALDAAALYRKVDQWRFYIIPQAISQSMRSAAIRPLISRRWRATLSCSCPQMRSGQRQTKRNETKRKYPLSFPFSASVFFSLSVAVFGKTEQTHDQLCQDRLRLYTHL